MPTCRHADIPKVTNIYDIVDIKSKYIAIMKSKYHAVKKSKYIAVVKSKYITVMILTSCQFWPTFNAGRFITPFHLFFDDMK